MRQLIAIVVIGVLLAYQVVRSALVQASSPVAQETLWPSHPSFELQRIMAEIGAAAAKGQSLSPQLLEQVDSLARRTPLTAEPFLIKGALSQTVGQEARAERLFKEALARDPRSRAARYFLADRYLRTGRTAAGLSEVAMFSRLTNSTGLVAPVLAKFAQTPGGKVELKRLLERSPELEPLVLAELASDTANLPLIMALWSGPKVKTPEPDWRIKIVNELIAQGSMARAHRAWAAFARVDGANRGLFNPGFEKLPAPPPFNWTYGVTGGVAEPLGDGRLQLIYYGREDATLAEQLMVLEPGRYIFAMVASGNLKDSTVAWSLTCEPDDRTLFRLPVGPSAGAGSASFQVPQGCYGQQLRLAGVTQETPRSSDFTVGKLSLISVSE